MSIVLIVLALATAPPECGKGTQWSTSAGRCIKTKEKPFFNSHCGWAGRSPGWCVR